jgi:DNA-binding MarR family transcriptional regulator
VLRVVSQFPGMSAAEAAHVVRLHPSTLTGVIQRLVDKGLLVRDRDPQDTRRMRLRVVRGAGRYTRQSAGTVEAAVKAALERMPATHITHARAVLAAVASALADVAHD